MTLEDFFTLTEIKDGLTALSRVHELVVVMLQESDCRVKNVGDATRQWAAVATTIAATDNKDCLDLFIQLDGLVFIDKWLKDAKKYDDDAADGFVEESLIALLRALEKLQIDRERSESSGILCTIHNLLHHASSRVYDRARALLDSWRLGRASNDDATERSKGAESAAIVDVSIIEKTAKLENNVAEPVRDENLKLRSSSFLQTDTNMEHVSHDPGDMPVLSNSIQESPPLKEKVLLSAVEGTTLTKTHSLSDSQGPSTKADLDTSKKLNDSNIIASPSSKVEAGLSSPTAATTNAREDTAEPAVQSNVDAKERDFGPNSMSGDSGISVSLPKSGKDDGEANNCISEQAKKETSPDTQPDSSLGNKKSENPEDIETPFSHMLDIRVDDVDDDDDDDGEQSSDIPEYLRDGCDFSKTADTQSTDCNSRRKSDIEVDYCMDDALQVARQVAQEVEREVVDDKIMASRDFRQPDSPDSINTKQDQNQAAEVETEAENGIHELESSQVTEVAPEQETKTEQGLCDFDLNQEVCSDETEHTTANPISTTPVSVVSASRPVVASGSPSAPLRFEGILGWKGSAATSAFRPASPRKISDSNSSKQRKSSLDFDLNVAEEGDQRMLDLLPGRPTPVSSGLQSGESSLEVGPRRSERPNLDLNRLSNEADFPQSSLRMMEGQLFYPRNGHRSPSPASSSSSMQQQPSLRNFDLNNRPFFHSDSSNASPFGMSGPGDPAISLLGTRVEVGGRKEIIPQHLSLGHGNPMDSMMMNADVARMGGVVGIPAVPYSHSPVFGYNGVTSAPHMSRSSTMYGAGASIPYMMDDTRVASMVPQIPHSQPSFLMNMASAGPSRPNLDLNSSFTNESGNSAGGGLRQFLMPGQSRAFEDHLRVNVQATPSSGLGVKRRETDGGWESYYLPYKHPQPPWR